jgi:hypothetical protein
MPILLFYIVFYLILDYLNRVKVKAKRWLLYNIYSLFSQVFKRSLSRIGAGIILYKD